MKHTKTLAILCMAAILCIIAIPASADEIATAGRLVVTKWQDAIVSVQLVAKTTVTYEGEQSPPEENKLEANALVIDPSGLVVAPLSEVSPDESASDFGEDPTKYSVSTEISDVKILMVSGQEIPAKLVLRDKELDLAFIRPIDKPAKPMTAVDLSKGAKPALLDQVLALSRQGIAANRALAASLDRIETVVEKPRFFSIPDIGLDMGASVFMLDGTFAGLIVMRQLPAAAGSSDWYNNSTQIILPAADILEAAKQAP